MLGINQQVDIALRWMMCGWRLCARNPWLMGGMGVTCAIAVAALSLVPLVGGPLIALVAPVFVASIYLAADGIARQPMALPASLRLPALKRSPLELVAVIRSETHVLPVVILCVYSMAVALLINLLVQLVAGSAWVARWSTLEILPLLGVLATGLIAVALYALLAMTLVYALALSVLSREALANAVSHSFSTSLRYAISVLMVLALLYAPYLLGNLLSAMSIALTYFVWIILGALILPIVTSSFYCSYRTLFAKHT